AQSIEIDASKTILEIGCGEGGVLKPFVDKGCKCLGVDLAQQRLDLANEYLAEDVAKGNVSFLNQNILEEQFLTKYKNSFDVIILKDVIEHIYEQEKFIPELRKLLKPNGVVFFGFPPWHMPFGGHQQNAVSKWASKLPYYHILPRKMYISILKKFGESDGIIDSLLEIKDTQITIERFEKIVKKSNFRIDKKQWFLINPIYKYKFGLNARKQNWLFGAVPFVRNFLTTCAYYTIR
nr:class I SAM-dependent methyltransferase [Chitinophagaceae bacterium]